ncbi:hypothetical protein ACWC09_24520 [Streptomyces sp. NPDC001617]
MPSPTPAPEDPGAPTWPPSTPAPPTTWPTPEWSSGASWPPVDLTSTPAPPAGPNRRLVWSVVVGAAVVGVAVSLVLTLVVGKSGDDGKRPVAAGSSASASAPRPSDTSSPHVEDTSVPSPSASTPPDGYELRNDKEGFRIAVPVGWTRSTRSSSYGMDIVNYRSADREHRLQIYQVQEDSPDASFELYLSDETPKPAGFQKLDLQNLDDGRFTGSRLEYLVDTISGEPDVGTWHVYDERFVAADGKIYAIASYGPESDGSEDELGYLTTALDWFCPPNTTCDADAGID